MRYPAEQFAKVPAEGPVLFVANRPYGVIDGLVLIWLARNARPDVMVLTHKLLCQAPESQKHLLPIDLSGGAGALASNVNSRKQTLRQLQEGGAIGIFPTGAVSTSTVLWRGSAVDTAGFPFAVKLPMVSKATITPIFFGGQNSRVFQLASHVNYTWRQSLLFWDTARKIGSELDVAIGNLILFEKLTDNPGRKEMVLSFDDGPMNWLKHSILQRKISRS